MEFIAFNWIAYHKNLENNNCYFINLSKDIINHIINVIVQTKSGYIGIVKYVGSIDLISKNELTFGVSKCSYNAFYYNNPNINTTTGINYKYLNGKIEGKKYFDCEDGNGLFIKFQLNLFYSFQLNVL